MTDIKQIAERLTEAQGRVMIALENNRVIIGRSPIINSVEHSKRNYRNRLPDFGHRFTSLCCLADKGLVERGTGWGPVSCGGTAWANITPLGKQVRTYLLEKENG